MDTHKQQPITFEQLPEAVGRVLSRLEQLEQLIAGRAPEKALKAPINTQDLCKFLDITEPTVTRYRKKGLIPFFTIGSAIRFDLDKVIAALESKKKK
jgi:hypothetical protein